MPINYVQLKTEILTDPKGLGYAGKTDAQITDLMNNPVGETLDRTIIDTWEIIEATEPAEWAALSAAEKQRYQTITGCGKVNLKGSNVRAMLLAMFAPGTQTRTNLIALRSKATSRAMFLFGIAVRHEDIARARLLP